MTKQIKMGSLFIGLLCFLFACEKEVLYQASDYAFVGDFTEGLEGPAVDVDGNLFFVNPLHNGSIGNVNPRGEFQVFIDSLPNGSIANGIRFDRAGNKYLADYKKHNVLRIAPDSKEVTIYVHEDSMNQPNDLAIMNSGVLFASDPNWAKSTGNVWRINLDQTATLLASDMGTTNGIEVSPDEKKLYVNESVQRKLWQFDLSASGEISNKHLLIEFEDFGLDGMRCDVEGNLYIARYGKGTIVKVSPEGEVLQEIQLKGEKPTNVAFGGTDGKTVYVTLQDRGYIEQFRVASAGRSFKGIGKK